MSTSAIYTPEYSESWNVFLLKARYKSARLIDFGVGKNVILNDPDRVWIVYKNFVNLFSVEVKTGETVGSRQFFLRIPIGHIIFGMPMQDRSIGLLMCGSPETQLLEFSRAQLLDLLTDPDFEPLAELFYQDWADQLTSSLTQVMPPREAVDVEPDSIVTKKAGSILYARRHLVWIRHLSGRSSYIKEENNIQFTSADDGYYPLNHDTWITLLEESEIEILSTHTLIQTDSEWKQIDHVHALVLNHLAWLTQRNAAAEIARLQAKMDADNHRIDLAYRHLAYAMDSHLQDAFATASSEDPLLAACQMVGKTLKVAMVAPPPGRTGAVPRIKLIAQASRLRTRTVALVGQWWKHNNGPLVGYLGEDKRPVALLPVSHHRYEMHDPTNKTRQSVDAQVNQSLDRFATMFYVSLPDRKLSWHDLLKFALDGSLSDTRAIFWSGIGIGIVALLTPIITQLVLDSVTPGGGVNQLMVIALALLSGAVATFMFRIAQNIAVLRVASSANSKVQAAIWDRVLELPARFFRDYTAGDLAMRMMGIGTIHATLSETVVAAILGGIFSVFSLLLLFYYSVYLAVAALVLVLVAVSLTLIIGWVQVRQLRAVTDLQGKISGYILQFINGMAKFRVAGAESRVFAFWAERFSRLRALSYRARTTQNVLVTFNSVYISLTTAVLFAAMLSIKSVNLSVGGFAAFNAAFMQFLVAGLQFTATLITVAAVIPLYERTKPILETQPEVDIAKTPPGELSGSLSVDRVSFRYRPDSPLVLKDISFSINEGEFVAIAGPSGCGKSTLLRMLLGFETPESGTVLYDGQDLKELDVRAVRRQIGAVLQNSQLMAGSDIFHNIIGSTNLTVDDAWEAARMVGLEEEIKRMPMGLFTVLSEGGGTLSGGQRQRILIARALVTRPRFLFFDEATSALDNRTQAIIKDSLDKLDASRIVIAHRLSTIVNADRIVVMDQGCIVQENTYKELINQRGLFADLAQRQFA